MMHVIRVRISTPFLLVNVYGHCEGELTRTNLDLYKWTNFLAEKKNKFLEFSTRPVIIKKIYTRSDPTRGHRHRSGWNSGGRMVRAQGGSVPSGVGYGEGCPFPSRLRGLGSVVSSPAGSGAKPWPKTDLAYFDRSFLYPYDTI